MRIAKSYTIDESIAHYVKKTRRGLSHSERINELLKRAILLEQYERLEREAAEFFGAQPSEERTEARAFQAASIPAVSRE